MIEFQAIWLIVVHYGHEAVIEFIVEIGDQFVTHYFLVLVLKVGAVHGVYLAVKHVRKHRAGKTPKE